MPGMILLPRLSLDQVSHAPSCPQAGAIAQHFGPLFQPAAQLLQLGGLQPRFTASSSRLKERLGSLFPPRLVPPTDRLAVNAELPGHLALIQASVKEPSGLESP